VIPDVRSCVPVLGSADAFRWTEIRGVLFTNMRDTLEERAGRATTAALEEDALSTCAEAMMLVHVTTSQGVA
jgi:hypothetical protein